MTEKTFSPFKRGMQDTSGPRLEPSVTGQAKRLHRYRLRIALFAIPQVDGRAFKGVGLGYPGFHDRRHPVRRCIRRISETVTAATHGHAVDRQRFRDPRRLGATRLDRGGRTLLKHNSVESIRSASTIPGGGVTSGVIDDGAGEAPSPVIDLLADSQAQGPEVICGPGMMMMSGAHLI